MDFFCVLAKLDHLAYSKFSKTRILLHAKWSNLQNTQQNRTKFSGMLEENKKKFKSDQAN